jgi:hypothetical protein
LGALEKSSLVKPRKEGISETVYEKLPRESKLKYGIIWHPSFSNEPVAKPASGSKEVAKPLPRLARL